MFTGLVESTGTVVSLESRGDQARLLVRIPFQAELALGDSVAINGCCLTVAELLPEGTVFDVLMQTLKVTSLGDLKAGSEVNLERAMLATSRFGGHFVQGHVDATGTIIALEPHGQDHRFEVALPPEIHRLCIDKGSACIDGISLTIAELKESSAVFWITPHTHAHTHLHACVAGQRVNLEADLLAKYVERLVKR
ncbi:riboflavin synthase [Luteolibacter sp. LG18]|uniref:riboflavin synthase n=1 Tax=Luteolibacter sp. LG18 TaxID=2819286 RepID=UPI002B2FF90F|nr:riboflavin synthase subunit alpha [Luteolibacter sp. LG18]